MKTLIIILLLHTVSELNAPIDTTETLHHANTEPEPGLTLSQVIDTCSEYYQIPRAVIIGTATLETGMGTGGCGLHANNLFSIRAYPRVWTGEVYKACAKCRAWRKYETPQESVVDFCKFVQTHYPYMIGRAVDRWALYGYDANGLFDQKGCFVRFVNN